jgi:segregation and condensation protein B
MLTDENRQLACILEAALLASGRSLSMDQILGLFEPEEQPAKSQILQVLESLQAACDGRGVELVKTASGYRYQARQDYAQWVGRLWEERPQRYSRALLETLALIAYRQPVTRGDIEDVRGVAVSSNIIKTLLERDWIKVIGHREVPGRPALYATTKAFLDYFNLSSLSDLPPLAEIRDLEAVMRDVDALTEQATPTETALDE